MLIRQQITKFLTDAAFAKNRKKIDKFHKQILNSEETTSLSACLVIIEPFIKFTVILSGTSYTTSALALPMIKIICEVASAKQTDDLLLKFLRKNK
ncbi:hypothetical protein A3Q56_04673 [Intoshia linei]|uniref:Uncharacterized protein n=1 Tax=Intoshia linei TaxID=1819745 RepID=A0A177B016_9BILA|nr:hypothetical protein A3Q56_04673 [Intoshia linei]